MSATKKTEATPKPSILTEEVREDMQERAGSIAGIYDRLSEIDDWRIRLSMGDLVIVQHSQILSVERTIAEMNERLAKKDMPMLRAEDFETLSCLSKGSPMAEAMEKHFDGEADAAFAELTKLLSGGLELR